MIRVAICNRNLKMVKQLEQWIIEEGDLEKRNVRSYCYRMGEDLLWDVEEQGGFDIAILDLIESRDIETAKRISVVNPHCQIIFLAESDKLACDAYLAHPFSFILMPADQEQLIGIYKEACYKTGKQDRLFRFHSHYVYYQIPVNHIMMFESEKRQIRVICKDGEELLFYNTLSGVEEYVRMIANNFIRIHHSFLINKYYVKKYYPDKIEMMNGTILPISDNRRKKVKEKMYMVTDE